MRLLRALTECVGCIGMRSTDGGLRHLESAWTCPRQRPQSASLVRLRAPGAAQWHTPLRQALSACSAWQPLLLPAWWMMQSAVLLVPCVVTAVLHFHSMLEGQNYGLGSLQVAQGLIYVWPEAGPQADAEAWSQKPHLLPWISEKVRFGCCGCQCFCISLC